MKEFHSLNLNTGSSALSCLILHKVFNQSESCFLIIAEYSIAMVSSRDAALAW